MKLLPANRRASVTHFTFVQIDRKVLNYCKRPSTYLADPCVMGIVNYLISFCVTIIIIIIIYVLAFRIKFLSKQCLVNCKYLLASNWYLYSVRGLERSGLGGSHGCPGRLWDRFL